MTRRLSLGPQSVRLLLAALLVLGSEVVLWPRSPVRPLPAWLAHLAGYFALSALLLDLMARFRARDLFGVLSLAGMYSLLAAVVLQPAVLLAQVPQTLISRVLGSQTLVAALMLAVFLGLLRRDRARILPIAAAAGILWGIMGRWFPGVLAPGTPETPFFLMLGAALIGLSIVGMAWMLSARYAPAVTVSSLLLDKPGWALVLLAVGALAVRHVAAGLVDALSLALVAALITFLGFVLAFQRNKRRTSVIEAALPPAPPGPGFLLPAALFLASGLAGYAWPRAEGESDLLNILGTLFIAFGVVWLPAVSLVLGGRAFMRQVRAQKL